jgi:hypothetical protein
MTASLSQRERAGVREIAAYPGNWPNLVQTSRTSEPFAGPFAALVIRLQAFGFSLATQAQAKVLNVLAKSAIAMTKASIALAKACNVKANAANGLA